MTTWRSTTLQMASDHCPKTLDFLEAGASYPREVFHVGTAAHACLEDIGKATVKLGRWLDAEEAEKVARETCAGLIAKGREFEGEWEPPLPSSSVWQGRDLALRYQAEKPLSPKYQYEATLAVSRDFLPCPSARSKIILPGEPKEGPWLTARIDAHGTSLPSEEWWEDEADAGPVLEVLDFKSSWRADESALYDIQRKIQAVLAWAHWGEEHEALRLVVVNFRHGKSYDTSVYPRTPEGAAVMARWRRDIETEIEAREGERIAAPGACCFGCPYLAQCPDAQAYLPRVYAASDPEDAARCFAVNLAVADSIEPGLRRATEEEPIKVPGGFVGTKIGFERRLTDDAPQALAEFWLAQAKPANFEQLKAMLPGLLAGAGVGTGQATKLLKKYLRKEKEDIAKREALLETLTRRAVRPKWGVHKGEPAAEVMT
jgi:PD-(D/E)XK nuclease superfamily protein